nr:F-box domain-containing protein [Tanacetum cinerariifolium]
MDRLPSSIMLDIFSRVPPKSLARSRCVSKAWCEYIDDHCLTTVHDKRVIEEPTPILYHTLLFQDRKFHSLCFHVIESKQTETGTPLTYVLERKEYPFLGRTLLVKFLEDHRKTQNEMDMNVTLHIAGQSTEVDVPPNIIIDVFNEDDDITDDEDALRHDLAESDNEDLINVDDDGKGKRKPNLGGRAAGRLNTRDKTRNLSLKEITHTKGPVLIQFELRDKQTVMPLGDHAAHWSSYIGVVIRAAHGIPRLDRDQCGHPAALAKGGSRSLARLRDEMMQTSTTQEYPSLIDTIFMAHTINEEFLWDEDQCIYEEIRRLEAMGTYTDDEINRLARGQKQRGHNAVVGRYCRHGPQPAQFTSGGASGSGGCGDEEEGVDHQDDEDEDDDGDTIEVRGSCNGLICLSQEEDNVITSLVMVHPLRKECYEFPSPPMCFVKHLGRESFGLGFDTSTNTWKMVCVLLKEDAPPDKPKPDRVKKNLFRMVHVFGTNSWREIPQVPSYLITVVPNLMHVEEEKVGVLLLNLGGPETRNDFQPFLYNLLADPDIIRLPKLFRFLQRPLAKLISTLRTPKSKEGYASVKVKKDIISTLRFTSAKDNR